MVHPYLESAQTAPWRPGSWTLRWTLS